MAYRGERWIHNTGRVVITRKELGWIEICIYDVDGTFETIQCHHLRSSIMLELIDNPHADTKEVK